MAVKRNKPGTDSIGVVVTGASGRMAKEVLVSLCREPDLEPVGAVSRHATADRMVLPFDAGSIPLSHSLDELLGRCRAQVMVDFTNAEGAMSYIRTAFRHGVAPVIGTTGLSPKDLEEIEALCASTKVGAVVAPNFALGAVLMMHMARIAARYFDYMEIIEMHHEGKADAPSGTAISTAKAAVKARGKPFQYPVTKRYTLPGTRGGGLEGVSIHSVRLPGVVAHQEVVFGGLGQTLTVRHDTVSRESFMPGVILAVREVVKQKRFICSLDKLLGLEGDG
ncbi:MAG: 4-hydroxy-tetrahydrodipicolinate reductase [Chloroflexi bacterium]|nr:4-hydroxy-tetrahydrodipicolinate reductase [Chloroflexota bacterium]